ncbi:MAG: selenium-dependent molybdenum cofactor biosynthesis protein YqeB [Lachnospiraceae bacterium]|nr:selenium-dependent molybdenum cofactor biosynthesis protein YqeB [Lachnospiraceae bacterium]
MNPVVVRGAGDLATGTIIRLTEAGYKVIILECGRPTAIRREAAFCEAVYHGEKTVEGITCVRAESAEEALKLAAPKRPVLLIDETGDSLAVIKPSVLVDAIIAKRNLGTTIDMADLTIGLGPGFTAGVDVNYVVETMRGHNLGRIIAEGSALPNTGVPGAVAGHTADRVIHAPAAGRLHALKQIADIVEIGEPIAEITDPETGGVTVVPASLTGVLRGILPEGFDVPLGMKMADIDPRAAEQKNCFTVSDKARCIAGSVLELVSAYEHGVLKESK